MALEPRTIRTIEGISDLKGVDKLRSNAKRMGKLSDELESLLRHRERTIYEDQLLEMLRRERIQLSPAEADALAATADYQRLKREQGTNANRTIRYVERHGLIGAVEQAVSRDKPTEGFMALDQMDELDVSYERVILNHPDAFSKRAAWFARKTLGLENETDMPPADQASPVNQRTLAYLEWLKSQRDGAGQIVPYTYETAAAAIGMANLQHNGQAFGNIQSRIDFACYQEGLPPLGLTAERPFHNAWAQEDRNWAYPVETMTAVAKSRAWTDDDFRCVAEGITELSGQAHIEWRREISENEAGVRNWAFSFEGEAEPDVSPLPEALGETCLEICRLQHQYSSANTPAMQRRGVLVRTTLGEQIEPHLAQLNAAARPYFDGEFGTIGRDGTGRKTLVPWHRIYNERMSPNPQTGWYVAFLFCADGSGFYLSLIHGSTEFRDGSFHPKPAADLKAQVAFAMDTIRPAIDPGRMVAEMDLKGGDLATSYENATAISFYYAAADIPSEDVLASDMTLMSALLARVYREIEMGRLPGSVQPEVEEIERTLRPSRGGGQGRGLNSDERRAVELRAMEVARQYLERKGFTVEDKSSNSSFDYLAIREDEEIVVEVKGTTGQADSVIMTANEIALHRANNPNNALLVVSGINLLDRGSNSVRATDGTLAVYHSWSVDNAVLQPIAYNVCLKGQSSRAL